MYLSLWSVSLSPWRLQICTVGIASMWLSSDLVALVLHVQACSHAVHAEALWSRILCCICTSASTPCFARPRASNDELAGRSGARALHPFRRKVGISPQGGCAEHQVDQVATRVPLVLILSLMSLHVQPRVFARIHVGASFLFMRCACARVQVCACGGVRFVSAVSGVHSLAASFLALISMLACTHGHVLSSLVVCSGPDMFSSRQDVVCFRIALMPGLGALYVNVIVESLMICMCGFRGVVDECTT